MKILKLLLFFLIIKIMHDIGKRYRKKYYMIDEKIFFAKETRSIKDWIAGSKETKYYWGFWVPIGLFVLLMVWMQITV